MDGQQKLDQQQLFDELYRQKIRQARSMTPAERVLASFELTDLALKVMAAGVRAQFPGVDEPEVQRIVRQRIDRVRRMENLSRMRAQELALATIDALHALGWDYLLVGGLAAIQHGITRTTYDVDIVLATESLNVAPLVRQLGPGFMLEEQRTFEVFTAKAMQVILLQGSALRIEFFPLGNDPFDQELFRRRRKLLLEGREVFMPTAEDVVAQKLRWGRAKDVEDARFILAVQGDALDFAYIEHWCDQHGTRVLLDKLRSEIPPE